ncbi:lytic murein transglycosylase [Tepidamorphus gemmatus]|uniref:Lytic murein transglycosylase n=1 Tax=Tepidamorphus gemmatus TaxID=747076 RepID=A0A4R3MNM4_9HYPH|nr:lytic murein transglycosylase [Tepidamorphus gemmatus]TCT13656.1 lytic murein transglycosylase [Tepidamorphus gemmatus]
MAIPGTRLPVPALALTAALLAVVTGNMAHAAQCQPPGGFNAFLAQFRSEAKQLGVSAKALAALDGLTEDRKVLSLDRNQQHFRVSFEEFARQRVTSGRISKGKALLKQHSALLTRIEQQFGVPGPILMAIWAMETDFGAVTGNMSVIRSLATLAHDCRRTQMFQNELLSALRLIDRGDLSAAEMRGAWAGELGQTQFLASNYVRFAVDYDGNGRRDLIRSVPDVLGSTANYLKAYGWQRGQPWNEGSVNFPVLAQWNKSTNYQKALALMATRIAAN